MRITVRDKPETHELTRIWLQRHVGTGNYGSKPQMMWSGQRAQCVYFRTLHAALMFVAGCPHIEVYAEAYTGPRK